MSSPRVQLFRMKPNCVVGGISWWTEGGIYSGRHGTGDVSTVELFAPNGVETLEVLRGSVFEIEGGATAAGSFLSPQAAE